jgi:hypothetical protein
VPEQDRRFRCSPWGTVTPGARHAATFSPLVAWVAERVEPGYASAVSALTTTAPQLAGALSFAGIGGLNPRPRRTPGYRGSAWR